MGTSSTSANVFRISSKDLLYITEIILELPSYDSSVPPTVIINVMYEDDYTGPYSDPNGVQDSERVEAQEVNMVAFGLTGLFEDRAIVPHIIWNFPYTNHINMSYVGLRGSILAPDADLYFPTGEMEGMVWVRSFEGQGQVNLPLFGFKCAPGTFDVSVEGRWGAPPLPDCYPHGFMTKNYTCECWDNTIYKGVSALLCVYVV